jgi:hypothetical protein
MQKISGQKKSTKLINNLVYGLASKCLIETVGVGVWGCYLANHFQRKGVRIGTIFPIMASPLIF